MGLVKKANGTKCTIVTRRASYERYPNFEIQETQELKENSENQNTKKRSPTWFDVWTKWAENKNFETNLLAYEAKQLDVGK